MRFFRPSWSIAVPPLLLFLLSFVPSNLIRQLFYGLLAIPLLPLINRLGLRCPDVGCFLAPGGAIFTAIIWAILLYITLCALRYFRHWTNAVVLAAVSAAAIAGTYVYTPDPDFAGGVAWYNMFIYFPLVILAVVCWLPAVVFYIIFMREPGTKPLLKVMSPLVLLLALPYETLWIVRWLGQFI
jgi:hypothetical protein